MKGKNITYMPAVDQLRAIAALLIIFYHGLHVIGYQLRFGQPFTFDNWLHSDNPLLAALIEGHTAVALFMVLSGFIFTYGVGDNGIRYSGFILNRILRIFPLFLLLYIAAVYLFPEHYTLLGLVQGVLLQSNLPGATFIEPFTSLFWTISVEFQFYLIFPFLLRFHRQGGSAYLPMLIGLFLIIRLIGLALGANPRDYSYYTILGRMDQFLFGMMLAHIYRKRPQIPIAPPIGLALSIIGLVIALAGLHALGGYPSTAWHKIIWPTIEAALWACFIYFYLVLFNRPLGQIGRCLAFIGEVSFSLYLVHLIVIQLVLRQGVFILPSSFDPLLNASVTTAIVVLPVAVGLSALTYHLIERPFLNLRQAYLIRPKAEAHGSNVALEQGITPVLLPSGDADTPPN
jgi:peptidoglycan/LPS O-acetylase OafA/YrhL